MGGGGRGNSTSFCEQLFFAKLVAGLRETYKKIINCLIMIFLWAILNIRLQ